MTLDAYFEIAPKMQAAREIRDELRTSGLDTFSAETSFCTQSGLLSVQLANGDVRDLDANNVTILVDGAITDGFAPDVEGETDTGFVPPGFNVTYNKSWAAGLPVHVSVATEDGVMLHAEYAPCPVLTTIDVTPGTPTMEIGDALTFTATGLDQYGAFYDAAPYTFSSTCGTITPLTGTTASLTAGTTAGLCTVTATRGLVSGQATVTISPDQPATILVTPDGAGYPAGSSQTFTATARDQYNNINTTATIVWSANAGSITQGGVLTVQTTAQMGRSVTATWTTVSDSATVNVYPAAPSAIVVSPSSTIVNTSLTRQFTATLTDQYGNANGTAPVTWSATRGSLDSNGLYTAPGTTGADTVTATSGAASGQATVTVQKAIHIDSVTMYKNNVTSSTFQRSVDRAEARVVVKDHLGNVVQGVSVSVQWIRPNTNLDHTDTVTSDASGWARAYWLTSTPTGTWTARVSAMSGTDMWYDTAANVETQETFSVTN